MGVWFSGGSLSPHTFFMVQFHWYSFICLSECIFLLRLQTRHNCVQCTKCANGAKVYKEFQRFTLLCWALLWRKTRKQKWVSISQKMFECEMLVMKRTMQCRHNAYLKRGKDKTNGKRNVYGTRQGEKGWVAWAEF